MAKKYLIKLYLQYFLLILGALVLFFSMLDYLQSIKHLPQSANLQILYLLYKSFYALDVLMPITLVFAMIALKLHLIRSNELVALYAIGIGKRQIIAPIFVTATFLTLFYLLLHLTSFTYADEYAKNIKKYQSISSFTKDLFFKFSNSYAFFERLYPLQKEAQGVRIFGYENQRLTRIVLAKSARFDNGVWVMEDAKVITPLQKRIEIKRQRVEALEGFRPKILDSVYEGKTNISLLDAIYALKLLSKQRLSTQKLRAILYAQLFYPFFAPLLLIVIFYFVPVSARVGNLKLFSFAAIVFSLVFWSFLYLLVRLSYNQTIAPELAILLPIALLLALALYLYKKF